MTTERTSFWDRLPLRFKGALIVGAPIAALLLGGLGTFWIDRQNDRAEAVEAEAGRAHALLDHVSHHVDETASSLQTFVLSENPSDLPEIDRDLLADVRAMASLTHPRTGDAYPGAEQASATLREVLLRARSAAREAVTTPTERAEDTLEYLVERMRTQVGILELPLAHTVRAETAAAREVAALERRESVTYLLVLLGGLVGGVVAVAFFARNVSARIAALGTAAEHLAAGDFTRPFPGGSDEIGALARRLYGAFSDLKASEETSTLILEASADGYAAMGPDWIVTAWNRSAEAILGWTKEEAIGRSLLELVVPAELRARYVADMKTFAATGESIAMNRRVESLALHKDGRVIPIELAVLPIEHAGRKTFHSFVRDLTDAKRAEQDIADRTLRMAQIIQTMNEMTTADLDVRVLHRLLLERAVSLTKADGAALQLEQPNGTLKIVAGVGPVAAQVGETLDIRRSMTGSTLQTGTTRVSGDLGLDTRVDHTLAAEIGARSAITVPLVDADHVVGVLAVQSARRDAFGEAEVTDIELLGGFFGAVISKIQASVAREVVVRERTEALEELRALHAELEAKNEALVLATEEATAANQAKSEFLSRMSHELRTPLNAILGFAQLLQSEALDEDQADSVTHIVVAGRHLLGLINEILEIARIESGSTPVSLAPVALGPLVRESADLIRPLAAARSIVLAVGEVSSDVCAWADEQKTKQIMLNLLSNAVKYNRPGGRVEVTVKHSRHAINVAVSDTGAGIAPEKIASLFTPFERLGAERTDVEGTGLGLAVSQKLAEAMGGSLSLSTAQGKGSTFTLMLEISEPGLPLSPPGSPPVSQGAPARDHSFTVVYVEDNASNARLVERALQRSAGVRLVVAGDAASGFEATVAAAPAVVLLDMNLPDAVGVEVLHRFRNDERTKSVPVVVLSADATADQMRLALDAGADGYLTKPVDLDELVRTVERFAAPAEVSA